MENIVLGNLPSDYNPLEDSEYMSPSMVQYFKNKLIVLHETLLQKENEILASDNSGLRSEPKHLDQEVLDEVQHSETTLRYIADQLRQEVEEALQRIDEGRYGHCIVTGEPIGIERLEIAPQARYCLKMQYEAEKEKCKQQ